jgi:hypothetical protein
MRSFDPFNKVIEALIQTGPISGGRVKPIRATGGAAGIAALRPAGGKLRVEGRGLGRSAPSFAVQRNHDCDVPLRSPRRSPTSCVPRPLGHLQQLPSAALAPNSVREPARGSTGPSARWYNDSSRGRDLPSALRLGASVATQAHRTGLVCADPLIGWAQARRLLGSVFIAAMMVSP